MSGNETLACFVGSGRRTASGGFVKVCLQNFAEGWVWFERLPQGVCSERGWRVEGGVGGGGKGSWKAKRRRRGEQSTESRHAVTVVRCYSAQALSR